eukprot:scaffold115202_cov15-Tisochrysis_lutea.AAC.1
MALLLGQGCSHIAQIAYGEFLQEDCVETRSGLGTLELLAQLTVAAVGLPAGHQASCLRSI